jgi:ribosome production factor 1
MKRQELYEKEKAQKTIEKNKERAKRKKEVETLGDAAPPPKKQRTLDNTREADDTIVQENDNV